MRSTGNVENVERNQCVSLHLVAGIFWNESGRSKRAPGLGGFSALVQEIRRLELTNALLANEASKDDSSMGDMIVKSNDHDVCHHSHGRDFRTLGCFLSSTLVDLKGGFRRIFDIGRGTTGYDVSVHLSPNNFSGSGLAYIDLIAHRHHMRWGKLVEGTMPKYLRDWKLAFSSAVHYPVLSSAAFVQHPTETDVIVPTPGIYCKRKVKIPDGVPLLQVGSKCGGRRNSVATEGTSWRTNTIEYDVEQPSLSWIPRPKTPILFEEDKPAPTPPDMAPPLVGRQETAILQHRANTIRRWTREDNASCPLISCSWRDNLSPTPTKCARAYLGGVEVGRTVGNLWK